MRYSLEDDLVFVLVIFPKRGYCVHLAALEHYLKNDEEGQVILQALEKGHEEQEEVETKVSFGGSFWSVSNLRRERKSTLCRHKARWKLGPIASFGLSESV